MKRILIIAGSDCSGGAGIQADIKTVSAHGGYAMSAITAVTAQNTLGVQAVHPVPPEIIAQQIESCLSDIGADAVKLGMLVNAPTIEAVMNAIEGVSVPIILDPVMVATSGDRLLDEAALEALWGLIKQASIITPNLPEAEILAGMRIDCSEAMVDAAKILAEKGAKAVLLKGGHMDGEMIYNLLYTPEEAIWFEWLKIDTRHTHGTGCTLAAALCAELAGGVALADAAENAQDYVYRAIRTAPGFGGGHGPLNHLLSR